jgi:hypothetical protein
MPGLQAGEESGASRGEDLKTYSSEWRGFRNISIIRAIM